MQIVFLSLFSFHQRTVSYDNAWRQLQTRLQSVLHGYYLVLSTTLSISESHPVKVTVATLEQEGVAK